MESAALASSSAESSTARVWKYDVFLSFRGPDTRKGITFELYDRLQNRGIKTFKDDPDLEVGDFISPTLLKAIKESRFAIVVLSPNYAYSTWCLEELAKICECMEDNNRILPLFYNVDPTDVRYPNKRSFGDAFTKHETSGRHRSEKVQQWRDALKKVANFSGWDSKTYDTDRQLVEDIVEFVYSKVQPMEINVEDFQEFEATRQAMNEVMKALKDVKVTAVGVYGMGGVGKTSLVKHVGENSRKIGIFHHVIMGVVSQSPDLIKIQDTLADLLGFKLKKNTEIGRAAELKKEIMRRGKILIILDDVWSGIKLSDVGIPSLKEVQFCNSKLLLTTRNEDICHSMGCEVSIPLNFLSEEDSWTLFVRNTRKSFDSTNFEDSARKVAAECKGLPIALIAVAKALGNKGLAEWKRAARKLENSQRAHPGYEDCAFECIKLSYDYLRDDDSKSCFLLCCLFPEDYDISIEELLQYAIGKGLFPDDDTIHEARETAYTVVKHLKNCSLLLDGINEKYVKMHDVIRDTALKIADGHGFLVKAGFGLTDWPCQSHGGYSAISVMDNKIRKLSKELVCPKLQILLLNRNADLNEISQAFFQCSNELRVLDLSHTSISLLPHSFILLTNLRALCLDFCDKIIDISILGKLKKLEILRMRNHPLKELSREIGNLTNLRILDVSGRGGMEGIVTIPFKVISKLHRLEELYMLDCGFEPSVPGTQHTSIGIEELAGLPNLKVLQVCITNAKCIPENVEVEPNLVYFDIKINEIPKMNHSILGYISRFLLLEDTTIRTLPDWFVNAVATKTEDLVYHSSSEELTDILMEYDHGRLHGLKSLSILNFRADHTLKVLMDTTTRLQKGPVFENLEQLTLCRLGGLEELCVGELPAGSFINLKAFRAADCKRLGNVSKLLYRLPNLEEIYLRGSCQIEYVFEHEGFEPEQSKLSEMKLENLNSLKSICKGPGPRAMFQSLKSLAISQCKILRSLFASDVAQCLFQLEELVVQECPLLERVIEASNPLFERVIEASNETMNSKKTVLPELKKLVLNRLPKLYTTADIELPSLEHLYVKDCPQVSFSTSASDFFHSRNHVQLKDESSNDEETFSDVDLQDCPCVSFSNSASDFLHPDVSFSTSASDFLHPDVSFSNSVSDFFKDESFNDEEIFNNVDLLDCPNVSFSNSASDFVEIFNDVDLLDCPNVSFSNSASDFVEIFNDVDLQDCPNPNVSFSNSASDFVEIFNDVDLQDCPNVSFSNSATDLVETFNDVDLRDCPNVSFSNSASDFVDFDFPFSTSAPDFVAIDFSALDFVNIHVSRDISKDFFDIDFPFSTSDPDLVDIHVSQDIFKDSLGDLFW